MLALPDTYSPSVTDRSQRMASYIVDRALDVYETDVRALVESQVRHSTAEVLRSSSPAEKAFAQERISSLDKWLKQPKPFSYGENSYTNLVKAIVDDPANLHLGLPASSLGQKSMSWFAGAIIESESRQGPRTLPPFIRSGQALAIMHIVMKELRTLLAFPGSSDDDMKNSITLLIAQVAVRRQILNIPWAPNPSGVAGRPPTTVVHDVWINLGRASSASSVNPIIQGPAARRNEAAARAASHQQDTDVNAPWSALDIPLQDLGSILHREVLPEEWDLTPIVFPAGESYVKETYDWVKTHYSGSKPIHQLALLFGIIFSRILPDIFHEKKPSNVSNTSTQSFTTSIVRNSPWTAPGANKKGVTHPRQFIVMMTTFIIAIYEKESPLRRYMARNSGSLGQPWTDKHGGL